MDNASGNDAVSIAGNGSTYREGTGISPAPKTRKRGRLPAKKPCLSKNALMARENRQKNKEYVQNVQTKLRQFQEENKRLHLFIKKQSFYNKKLLNQVTGLKNVIKNGPVINSLLVAINESLKKFNNPLATMNRPEISEKINNAVNIKNNMTNSLLPCGEYKTVLGDGKIQSSAGCNLALVKNTEELNLLNNELLQIPTPCCSTTSKTFGEKVCLPDLEPVEIPTVPIIYNSVTDNTGYEFQNAVIFNDGQESKNSKSRFNVKITFVIFNFGNVIIGSTKIY